MPVVGPTPTTDAPATDTTATRTPALIRPECLSATKYAQSSIQIVEPRRWFVAKRPRAWPCTATDSRGLLVAACGCQERVDRGEPGFAQVDGVLIHVQRDVLPADVFGHFLRVRPHKIPTRIGMIKGILH